MLLEPFFPAAWIQEGMHITTVRPSEMTLDALLRCDLIAVSTREAAKLFTLPGEENKVPEFGRGDYGRAELENTAADWRNKPELSEIIAGKAPGRTKEREVACMLNHLGLGCNFQRPRHEFTRLRKCAAWEENYLVSGFAKTNTRKLAFTNDRQESNPQ